MLQSPGDTGIPPFPQTFPYLSLLIHTLTILSPLHFKSPLISSNILSNPYQQQMRARRKTTHREGDLLSISLPSYCNLWSLVPPPLESSAASERDKTRRL